MRPSGIGGQAVLEGIMMKNKEKYSVAVRKPDGQIEVHTEVYKGIAADKPWAKLPLIRGMVNFIDSLILGMESLSYSASFYEDEEQDQEPGRLEKLLTDVFKEKAEKVVMGCTVAFSIFMAVAIFMVLPYVISGFFRKYIVSNTLLAIVEGVIRLGLFTLYVVLISCMKDIKRTYMYHGAEHKCINCIERGRELNVRNVRKSSRYHARCGTSFLFIVMIISIIFFIFIRVESPNTLKSSDRSISWSSSGIAEFILLTVSACTHMKSQCGASFSIGSPPLSISFEQLFICLIVLYS